MKRFILILSFVLAGVTAISAQDLIVKKNGEDQQAKILEVGQNEIKYRKWDNLEGPIYSIPVSEILLIRYENGTNEVFNKKTYTPVYNGDSNREVSSSIMPGMRYKDYHKLYKASDYIHATGDRYSPALGGVLSFLIPGLGQMVCGEVGRGFSWFGGAMACSVVMGVGAGLTAGAYEEDMAIAGLVLTLAGSISLLSVDIAAIVDGVKVAKIKNMYQRDTREMSSVKLDMSPYFTIAPTGISSAAPVAGMSLRLSF